MAKVEFRFLERNKSIGKGTFNVIKGTVVEADAFYGEGEKYEGKYFASKSEFNDVMNDVNVGDIVDITHSKNGKYVNIQNVAKAAGGSGGGGTAKTQQGKTYNKRAKKAQAGGFREPIEVTRNEALKLAQATVVGMAAHAETFGKVMKKTATMDVIQGAIIDLATVYTDFITGKLNTADPESSKKDLDNQGGNYQEDDIPF